MWDAMEGKSRTCSIMGGAMEVSITDAKKHLAELLRSVEDGEHIVISHYGIPVAQLIPPPPRTRVVRFGTMRGRVHLKAGWDDPIDVDQFVAHEF
jgi:prevent-host-death family protein